MGAGEADRRDLALAAALAEAAGDQHAAEVTEVRLGAGVVEQQLGVDVDDVDRHVAGEAAVDQRLVQALVALGQVDVLADHADADPMLGVLEGVDDALPGLQLRLARPDVEQLAELVVEALGVQHQRDLVDRVLVGQRHHAVAAHVGEHRQLVAGGAADRLLGAADQDVGLDPDLAHLHHRVLGRLGLDLAGGLDIRQQGQVHAHGVARVELQAQLPDRLEERQALDVADRAADLDDQQVQALRGGEDAVADRVGDVRDDLHRLPEVLAAPLLADHRLVDLPRGVVAVPRHPMRHEALVVPEVEVRLGAVVGDEDLAVLGRVHRPRVDVKVGVELLQPDVEAAGLEQRAHRRRAQPLAQRRHDAARDEDEFRVLDPVRNSHGPGFCHERSRGSTPSAVTPPAAGSRAAPTGEAAPRGHGLRFARGRLSAP